jgi:23S rRNA (adenine2503-C2)-methyltransferase
MAALEIITDRRGINIGPGRVTISTVGVVPGILRLAKERQPYGLAVSLHGASEEERAALVPASRRWPLAELIAACREYGLRTGRRIFFEWTLIAGRNDSAQTARRLAALLQGMDAHINLIPLNPTGSYSGLAASAEAVRAFQRVLQDAGFPATVRQRRGIDVAAGCGQLRADRIRPGE